MGSFPSIIVTVCSNGWVRVALGVTGAIKSPTYALVESYETTKGEVHHLDAYRIESSDDFEARGGFEYFDVPCRLK